MMANRIAILALVCAACDRVVDKVLDECDSRTAATCTAEGEVRRCVRTGKMQAYGWETERCLPERRCVQVANDAACVGAECDPKSAPVITAKPGNEYIEVRECTLRLGDKTYLRRRRFHQCDPKTFKPRCIDTSGYNTEECVPLEPALAAVAPQLRETRSVACKPGTRCDEATGACVP